jgi:hypothetical protein
MEAHARDHVNPITAGRGDGAHPFGCTVVRIQLICEERMMSFVKLHGAVRIMLAALAVVAISSQAARAETIFLQCGQGSFTVDLTNNTVNNLPATGNATGIDWQVTQSFSTPRGTETTVTYNPLDRTAGTLTNYFTLQWPGGNNSTPPSTISCTLGSRPPTKF